MPSDGLGMERNYIRGLIAVLVDFLQRDTHSATVSGPASTVI